MQALIKIAKFEDLRKIVACHRRAFSDSLATALGAKYVNKMLEWYITGSKAFLLWMESEDKCIGYCGGIIIDGSLKHGSATGMAQYSFNEGVIALLQKPWLIMHREMIRKYSLIFKNIAVRLGLSSRKPPENPINTKIRMPYAGLVTIAVDPVYQNQGLGQMLLNDFQRHASGLGLAQLKLTVKTDNVQAIRAYEKNGWITFERRATTTSMLKTIR